jgi:hypothetical protein
MLNLGSLNGSDIRSLHVNTTDTLIVGTRVKNFEVSLLTPVSSPRVSDNPVVLSSLGSITNDGNTVIKGSAASTGHDSTDVGEAGRGVNGDRDSSEGGGGVEGKRIVGWNVGEGDNLSDLLGLDVLANSVSGGVWVVGGLHGSLNLEILESVVHPSTVATLVTEGLGAINELLLGHVNQRVSGDLPSGL